jgi:hypothetical protein
MKLRDVASLEQGISSVLNRTHPEGVLKILLSPGLGKCISLRTGGTNTETIKRPETAPANSQSEDSIIRLVEYLL